MKSVLGPGSQRAVIWWRRLVVMTRKEMLQLFRDVPIVLFLVYSFTLAVYITGNGLRSQLHNASLAVYDADHSFSSRELIHKFQAPFFRLEGEIADPQEGLRLLDRGKAMAILEIPPRFHEQLVAGEPTAVHRRAVRAGGCAGTSREFRGVVTELAGDRERSAGLVQPGPE
jgi:ABC-2 type transport system permease protein